MTATLVLRAGSLADPGDATLRLSAEQARGAGLWLDLRRPAGLPATVLALHDPPRPAPGITATIMAASPGGSRVAIAEGVGPDPATLVITEADGAQLRIPFDGLLSAAFAPDASWLAVTDGRGRLWQVDPADGESRLLAAGPFTGRLVAEPTGGVLALSVPSVEAPFMSRLVRVAADGTAAPLSDEELVYDVQVLDGEDLAVVAHRPAGTVVLRLDGETAQLVLDLGTGAVNVATSRDLRVVAWERAGEVLVRRGDAGPMRIGPGANPRVSADGGLILVDVEGGTSAYTDDGALLARLDDQVVLLECEECES